MTAGIRVSVTQPSAPTSMEHTPTQGCHLVFFSIFNMNSSVIFAGALAIFAGALPPCAPPLITGWRRSKAYGGICPSVCLAADQHTLCSSDDRNVRIR